MREVWICVCGGVCSVHVCDISKRLNPSKNYISQSLFFLLVKCKSTLVTELMRSNWTRFQPRDSQLDWGKSLFLFVSVCGGWGGGVKLSWCFLSTGRFRKHKWETLLSQLSKKAKCLMLSPPHILRRYQMVHCLVPIHSPGVGNLCSTI